MTGQAPPAALWFVSERPLHPPVFVRAIGRAAGVRPGHHTVLSGPGAVEGLQEYVADVHFRDGDVTPA